jgi:dienelactone hydrolase
MTRRDLLKAPLLTEAVSLLAADEFPKPDLGDIFNVLDWTSRQNRLALSFLDPKWKSLDVWKQTARPFYRRLLSYDPPALPIAAETLGREEREGFRIERVKIQATGAYDIPGWVLTPSKRSGRVPAVVAIHCHGGNYTFGHEKLVSHPGESEAAVRYRDQAYKRPFAEYLVRRGYVVLVIDGLYFGSRRLQVESLDRATVPPRLREFVDRVTALPRGTAEWYAAVNRACSEFEHLTAKTIFTAGATWPGMLAWDDMRSVDYLCSRPDVDASRIGCVGLSIGGLRTAHLVAADPRIRAACVVGWMTEFRSQLRNHLRNHTWMIYIPGLYSAMDLPDAAALMAPNALFVQQCAQDRLYPMSGMKGSVDKLTRIYAKAGVPERFRSAFYDVPHSFTPDMQEQAFDWLDKWLK